MEIDFSQLPIPDWDINCPECGYPLRGLPEHRCPECGLAFDVAKLIQPWTRLRPPRFTGYEHPLPDFGLSCDQCAAPLAGAAGDTCPQCRAPFDVAGLRPARDWFAVDSRLCHPVPVAGLQVLLAHERVPHFEVRDRDFSEIYGGRASMSTRNLRVTSEFYFEVLWLIERTRREMAIAPNLPPWTCPTCKEENPGNFGLCWNCNTPQSSPNEA